LSIRLAAWSLSESACSMTKTRREDSNGVCVAAATTASSMSPTSRPADEVGAIQVRSGCAPERTRAAAPSGSREPSESSAAANSRATSSLPLPAGPANEVGVRGVAREDRAGVRVLLGAGQRAHAA
jgi:hypothetical protein